MLTGIATRAVATVALASVALTAVAALGSAATRPRQAAAAPAPLPAFGLTHADVTPARAYFDGRPVRIDFAIRTVAPLDLRVEIARQPRRTVVRRFTLAAVAAQSEQHVTWDGLTDRGRVAPNGRYVVRVVAPGGRARRVGALSLHSHIFPVRGPHGVRGAVGRFGAPRTGGRTHEGFDVVAACGTPLAAARGGRVVRNVYDPVLYGNLLVIRGRLTQRDYWYAHMIRRSPLRVGRHVRTGARIGRVGETGNARTVGCHLHFEILRRGIPIDPEPDLRAWDRYS